MWGFNKRKVFCIGFNKTGTSSLHSFFKECRLSSLHNTEWPDYSKLERGRRYFRHQCYSDGEQSNFINLEKWFPRSLFILNDRDEKDWLYSRIKHVMRFNEEVDMDKILSDPKYGKMAKEFFFDEEAAIKKWVYERRIYNKQVRSYFKNKQNFIDIDITKNPNWVDDILTFFNENNFSVIFNKPAKKFHINKRSQSNLIDQKLLQKYLEIVDKVLDS